MRIRKHLTYANVAATLALAGVIGGGGAYAAGVIDSGDIENNSIRSADIKNRVGVKGRDVAEKTLDAAEFARLSGSGDVTCNPPGTLYATCAKTPVRMKARGRLLIIATGDFFTEGGDPGGLECRIAVDGANETSATFAGDLADQTESGSTDGFARTLVTRRLSRGRHIASLRCQDSLDGSGRLRGATIAVLGISG